MDLNGFYLFAQKRGFFIDGEFFCGSYKGFPFSGNFIGSAGKGAVRIELFFCLRYMLPRPVRKELHKKLPKGSRYKQNKQSTPPVVIFIIKSKDENTFCDQFDTSIEIFTSILTQYNIMPMPYCAVCGASGCDSYSYISGNYRLVHQKCAQVVAQSSLPPPSSAAKNKRPAGTSYLVGALGALLGGFVGMLFCGSITYFTNWNIYWLYFILPFFSYMGYRILNGKMTRAALFSIIPFSVLFSFVGTAIVFMLTERKHGVVFTSRDIINFLSPSLYPNLWVEWILMAIFLGLGILTIAGIVNSSLRPRPRLSNAELSIYSMRPVQKNDFLG